MKKHNPKHNIARAFGKWTTSRYFERWSERLKNLPAQIKVRRVSDVRKLLQLPQVKAHLEIC